MVEIKRLASMLQDKELNRQLVGTFSGAYSVGIGADPDNPKTPAIVLHVEGEVPPLVPRSIQVGEDSVRVITKTGFVVPMPL
jgi:hypothetical protein